MSKDKEEQLKLVHKKVDVLDCRYRKICVTLQRQNFGQAREVPCSKWLFAEKMEAEKF